MYVVRFKVLGFRERVRVRNEGFRVRVRVRVRVILPDVAAKMESRCSQVTAQPMGG